MVRVGRHRRPALCLSNRIGSLTIVQCRQFVGKFRLDIVDNYFMS